MGTRLAKRAKFKRDHPVVLLQVGAAGADTSYGVVRHGWRIGRRWTDPSAPDSPRWAVVVAGELVVGVYRIDGWEPTPLQGRPDRTGRDQRPGPPAGSGPTTTIRSTYRLSFIGERDEQLEDRYLGRSVAPYLVTRARNAAGPSLGAPNQVTYVGCGPTVRPPAG